MLVDFFLWNISGEYTDLIRYFMEIHGYISNRIIIRNKWNIFGLEWKIPCPVYIKQHSLRSQICFFHALYAPFFWCFWTLRTTSSVLIVVIKENMFDNQRDVNHPWLTRQKLVRTPIGCLLGGGCDLSIGLSLFGGHPRIINHGLLI